MSKFSRKEKDNSQDARRLMMANEPIHKVIPKMAIPTIIAFLINSIYGLADTFFVSSLGLNATAAVSVNQSLDQLIMMFGSMLALGSNAYIARLLGAGREKKASETLSTAFFTAMFFGVILLIFGVTFMTPMVRMLGATPTCEQYSIDYATYVLFAAPFMVSNFVMNQCLRSEGSSTLSMIGMGFGGILNCFLDPIFIFTFDMGVAGASLATAISKVVSFAILVFPYITRRSMLHLSIRNYKPDWEMAKEVFSVGSSALFRSGLAVVSAILINREAGMISDAVLAGIGVTNKVMMFPFSIILGFGSGYQPVSGFNWGAKNYKRVRKSYSFALKTALIGSVIMAVFLSVFAVPVIRLFAGADAEMELIGSLCIRLQCIAMPIHAWAAMVNMLCSSLGVGWGAVLLASARQGTCFLPVLYPLSRIFGATGIASVQAVADALTIFLAVPISRKIFKIIAAAEQKQQEEQASSDA